MKSIRVGLMGMGTVGSGVARILEAEHDLIARRLGAEMILTQIAEIDPKRHQVAGIPSERFTTDPRHVIHNPDVDIVVELMGGIEPARTLILEALDQGKPVVTANKALLASCGEEIFGAAEKRSLEVGFEASVGGGIPIIRVLREGLSGERISAIYGIVNGTSNYILTRMSEEGLGFSEVLRSAQVHGYAEADPTLDVRGGDAAHKLALLASLAYGTPVSVKEIYTEGIDRIMPLDIAYADALGYKMKLLAIAKVSDQQLEVRVHPTLIPKEEMLAQVNGVFNAICVVGESLGESLFYGRGAGAMPTGSAVISDLVDIARNIQNKSRARVPPRAYAQRIPIPIKPIEAIQCGYYLRFYVEDRPGVLSEISGVLGRHHISIASVIQKGRAEGSKTPSSENGNVRDGVSLVMMTYPACEKDLQAALSEINPSRSIFDPTVRIRVESKIRDSRRKEKEGLPDLAWV